MYNSLNNKILPQLDHEITSEDNEIGLIKDNFKGSKNCRPYYNSNIDFDSEYEWDVSYVPTNYSFFSKSKENLQWDEEI